MSRDDPRSPAGPAARRAAPASLLPVAALLAAFAAGGLPVVLALADLLAEPGQALDALLDPVLWPRLMTGAGIAGATLLVILPLGLGLAWLLARTDLPGRRLLLLLAPVPLFLPPLVHVLSWFGLFGIRGFPGIVLVYSVSFLPFVVLTAARAFDAIGREQMETMLLLGGRSLVLADEIRQAAPSAMVGGALACVFLLGDFAVADFLTSVGPKVTVYADTLYAHHLALRPSAAVAVALPGVAISLLLLFFALGRRRRLGAAVNPDFEPAPVLGLGRARWGLGLLAAALVGLGTVLPAASLFLQAGSLAAILEQAAGAADPILFSLGTGAAAAAGMVALGIPLATLASRLRRPFLLDLVVFLPLAAPPLLFGVGMIRTWNHPGLDGIYLGAGAVVIAMIGRYLPFAYLPVGGAIERLDPALFEAARLAGAGAAARAGRILLPLIAGPAVAAFCISFAFSLRELDTLIMLRAGRASLTVHLFSNVVFSRQDEIAALALVLAAVTMAPLLLYLLFFRRAPRIL